MHNTTGRKHQDLGICLINPGEWDIILPKNKTVQQIQPLSGNVHINRIVVEQKEVSSTTDTIVTPKNTNSKTDIVMPGDYTPHQQYELEDANVTPQNRKKLEELIWKYDCIVSKHANDISTTPLLKMEIETERPPIASQSYILPLKHHSFIQNEIANLEQAGVIKKSLSPYASPIVVV